MRAVAAASMLILLSACAGSTSLDPANDAGDLAELTAGRTAGEPQRCISPTLSASPRAVGGAVAYQDGNRLWISRTPEGCPSLRGDPILIVELYGSQVCENDRFRTVERGVSIPGPYCRFGPFVPYDRPR